MGDSGCAESIEILNFFFDPRVLANEGPEIVRRLTAGEPLTAALLEMSGKYRRFSRTTRVMAVKTAVENWPVEQHEPLRQLLIWSVQHIVDGGDLKVRWKGDAQNDETVMRFEIKEGELTIEFAHPPAEAQRLSA